MFFLQVATGSLNMELAFPAAAKDRAGRSLDLALSGQWRIENPYIFLQQGAQKLAAPGNPLLNSTAEAWIANKIRHRVHDEFEAAARDFVFADLVSRQVLPLDTWQSKLRAWLAEFGIALELVEVRPTCAEAARQQAAREQVQALKQASKLQLRVRQVLLDEARSVAEYQNEVGRLEHDRTLAEEARQKQLADWRIANRQKLFESENKLQELARQADEAKQKHLLQMAELRNKLAEAELARVQREQQGKLNQECYEYEQRLVLARMEKELQEINLAKQAQAQAFAREAQRMELIFQAEMDDLKKDLAFKTKLKDEERAEILRQAQGHSDRARAVHSAASQHAAKLQQDTPKLAVLSTRSAPKFFEIVRSWFYFGRLAPCHVVLDCPQVSAHHGAVAQTQGGWLVVDHESRNGSFLNGERVRQQHIVNGDVLRAGDFWLVFALRPEHEYQQIADSDTCSMAASGGTVPLAGLPAGMTFRPALRQSASALVQLNSSSGQTATSDGGPILIGHGSTCTLSLAGGGVARFHAMVFWEVFRDARGTITEAGVFVEDLHSGRGLVLNGQPVQRAQLHDRDVLEIGGHRITVSFHGNVRSRAESLAQKKPPLQDWAITCVEGPAEGKSLKLSAAKERIIIGRHPSSDLVLDAPGISRNHAELRPATSDGGSGTPAEGWTVADLNSTAGSQLNGKRLSPGQTAKLRPGDILRLAQDESRCDLLVHYTL
jgi:pSer/pThr/pTyr-binding forkhead associated (FHA) protein